MVPPSKAASRGPAGARSVQPSSDKSTSSPSGVARTHRSISWSIDAATAGRETGVRSCARAVRPLPPAAAPAPAPNRSRPVAAAPRAQGRRRPAAQPCPGGRSRAGAQMVRWPSVFPIAATAARRPSRRSANSERRLTSASLILSKRAIAAPGSPIPRRSPIPASRPAAGSRRTFRHAQQRHHAIASPESSSSRATSPLIAERRASAWAMKSFRPHSRGADPLVIEVASSSSSRTSVAVRFSRLLPGSWLAASCALAFESRWSASAMPTRSTSSRRNAAAIDWTRIRASSRGRSSKCSRH